MMMMMMTTTQEQPLDSCLVDQTAPKTVMPTHMRRIESQRESSANRIWALGSEMQGEFKRAKRSKTSRKNSTRHTHGVEASFPE